MDRQKTCGFYEDLCCQQTCLIHRMDAIRCALKSNALKLIGEKVLWYHYFAIRGFNKNSNPIKIFWYRFIRNKLTFSNPLKPFIAINMDCSSVNWGLQCSAKCSNSFEKNITIIGTSIKEYIFEKFNLIFTWYRLLSSVKL